MAIRGRLCWRRATIAIVVMAIAAGCSGSSGDALDDDAAPTTATSSTTPTTSLTTTTTEPTTSTLSEQAQAEAEIERIITEWWTTAYNPDTGQGDGGAQYLTGLMATRLEENLETYREEGRVPLAGDGMVVEVTSVEADLERGTGTATSCGGSDYGFYDLETLELIGAVDDPDYQTTSDWLVELTEDGWKINEWYPSWNTGSPVECTTG